MRRGSSGQFLSVGTVMLAGLLIAVGCTTGAGTARSGNALESAPGLPADLSELGEVEAIRETDGFISEADAVKAAVAAGYAFPGKPRAAFLVRLSSTAIGSRPVWVVRFTGLSVGQPAPLPASGTPLPVVVSTRAYVVIDAVTAAFISTLYL